ncbi:MAG: hypothetical protein AAGI11_02220 [Pseudomonadota bacterium]
MNNKAIESINYMGHSLDGLLYDAQKGSTTSTQLIYQYFCNSVEKGNNIPPEVQELIASEMSSVLSGNIKPSEMFNPSGSKVHTWAGEAESLMSFLLPGREFLEALELTSEMTGVSEGTIKDHYYKHQARIKRIAEVTTLIRTQRNPGTNSDEASMVSARLEEIYERKPEY